MINVSIARRYARALLAVSLEAGRVDEVLRELQVTAEAIAGSSRARDLFQSPGFTREARHALLAELSRSAGHAEPTTSFLKLLVDRGRIEHIEEITRVYEQLADEAAGRIRAEVRTARELDPEAARSLAAAFSRITNKTVEVEQQIDEELLGGLVVKVGDRVFDGSIKTQLEKMREAALS